jgi:predicted DNA-binding transcriptional regulator AlpA
MLILGEELWDIYDIGRECGKVSHTTVYAWTKFEDFPVPFRKVGKTRYWKPSDVNMWFDDYSRVAA